MDVKTFLIKLSHVSIAKIASKIGIKHRIRNKQRTSKLSLEQISLLLQMRTDNSFAPATFRPAEIWNQVMSMFEQEFQNSEIDKVETSAYNLRFAGFTATDYRLHEYFVWTYYQLLKQIDKYNLLKTVSSTAPLQMGSAYEIDGCKISLDQLLSIDDFYNLVEINPEIISDPLIIADIGAGWGRIGYIIKKVNPKITYVVFDLPESLLISSTYLPKLLPSETIGDYLLGKKIELFDKKIFLNKGMWFLGSQDIMKVANGTFDIVINIASFQEMIPEQVKNYFNIINDKASGGYLYLRQLWLGKTHNHSPDLIAGFESYPFLKEWEQLFLRNSRFSKDFFDAAFRINH